MINDSRDNLDEVDKVKLATWNDVIWLMEYYRKFTFDPLYSGKKGHGIHPIGPQETRDRLLNIIRERQIKLIDKWEKALGPEWDRKLGDWD